MRIGIGYDSHRFVDGDCFKLGGVKINYTKKVLSHSDGDALLHAITDALLGAASLGDIGLLFPDNDPNIKGIDSGKILAEVMKKVRKEGYEICNIDATIILERPKLRVYIQEITENIKKILESNSNNISIKAKTNEGMGWIGKNEGIAVQVVVLIDKLI